MLKMIKYAACILMPVSFEENLRYKLLRLLVPKKKIVQKVSRYIFQLQHKNLHAAADEPYICEWRIIGYILVCEKRIIGYIQIIVRYCWPSETREYFYNCISIYFCKKKVKICFIGVFLWKYNTKLPGL